MPWLRASSRVRRRQRYSRPLNVTWGARTVQMNPHAGQRKYSTNSVVSVTAGGSLVAQQRHTRSGGAISVSEGRAESSVCIRGAEHTAPGARSSITNGLPAKIFYASLSPDS